MLPISVFEILFLLIYTHNAKTNQKKKMRDCVHVCLTIAIATIPKHKPKRLSGDAELLSLVL